jgi:hypothetical protein
MGTGWDNILALLELKGYAGFFTEIVPIQQL